MPVPTGVKVVFGSCALVSAALGQFALAQEEGSESSERFASGPFYTSERQQQMLSPWGYASAYRAGDMVYVAGVPAISRDEYPLDAEQYADALRFMFRRADASLQAAGSAMDEVVDIQSYHVWDSGNFAGAKAEATEIFVSVKAEFMGEHTPAWTAVGVPELYSDRGLVELRLVAYSPQ